jgi:hypothetical protein
VVSTINQILLDLFISMMWADLCAIYIDASFFAVVFNSALQLQLILDGCKSLSFCNIHRRNWPEKDNTWEPYGHVARCRDILEEFEARYTFLLPLNTT